METKNAIEDKIEREHFEHIFLEMMGARIASVDDPNFIEKRERDCALMKDYLEIGAPELEIQELSRKYNICSERVKQIINKSGRLYLRKRVRGAYLNGNDKIDWSY
jgi:Mor family transcriptional regulator